MSTTGFLQNIMTSQRILDGRQHDGTDELKVPAAPQGETI